MPVLLKQRQANILCPLTDTLPWMEREVSSILNRLTSNFLVVFIVERQHSAQQQVGDDAEGPVVYLLAIGLLQEDLGCDVRQCAKGILASLVGANNLGQAEVYNLKRRIVIVVCHKNVLRFEVPMCHTI